MVQPLETAGAAAQHTNEIPGHDCARIEIDGAGIVCACDARAETLLGAGRAEILGTHVSRFFTRFAGLGLVRAGSLDPNLAFQCRCGVVFRLERMAGAPTAARLFVSERVGADHDRVRLLIREIADDVSSDEARRS